MLLSIPSKVQAKQMRVAVDKILRDEQVGFRKDRSCINQIATLRIMIEQTIKWSSPLYLLIISSKTACDFVCPLKSIAQDKASLMDLTATSLASASLQDVENGKYQLIFASAEEILAKPFLSSLKNRIYTTRKTVTRRALKRLHLNHVVSERPKGE